MKSKILVMLILLTFVLTACGSNFEIGDTINLKDDILAGNTLKIYKMLWIRH